MISSVVWIPRGVAKSMPVEHEPTPEELEKMRKDAEEEEMEDVEDTPMTTTESGLPNALNDPDLQEYNMADYDKEEGGVMMSGAGMEGLMYYENPEGDPYVEMGDSDSEAEDFEIRPTDSLLVCAKTEEEVASLEIYVYEEGEENLYVHHDILLPAFPLCLSWVGFSTEPQTTSNCIAVGTFHPGIEVWDLDVIDAPSPVITLGGVDHDALPATDAKREGKKKKKNKKQNKDMPLRPGSHTDAVMGLAWNATQRNLLASASADTTVKLWDLAVGTCSLTFNTHTDKVQAVAWHPTEAPVLASAGFDRVGKVLDCRVPGEVGGWKLSADAECLAWNPHKPDHIYTGSEDGMVIGIDRRNTSKPLFQLQAHNASANTISFSANIPELLATGSVDKTVKLWDCAGGHPSHIDTITSDLGTIFTSGFCPEAACLLATAGGKGKLKVQDLRRNNKLARKYEAKK